ncbi:tripartite tricarboxylate transporter substrate binding protein [Bordetella sp. BOR01]|uniref:Bug family tripartite tricarboxylate transporter substrate binding protein n=1 Tax=Bordetella sp. BOR01 TaxID=2854779 RepID=UPI001C478305|nr:tripartite tricarboxylate transporter substrate binding protein [Bordetella sp. BOR01]MBV7483197.1 tripartite tricarboxylate transporter substrate binding protein [Bordetella sp. BOR01]
MKSWQKIVAWVAMAIGCGSPLAVASAEFPSKPVTIVVGYAPGGATDVTARILAKSLAKRWKQTVVVENRSGASGMIGAEYVARAASDGYVLLLGYTPEVSINTLIYKTMSYDPRADLAPIALVSSAHLFLVSGPKMPVDSFQALMKNKGRDMPITFGSPGIGGQQHLAGEYLALQTGLQMMHIPYKGASPAVADLLGGQFDVFFSTPPVILPHIRTGRLKPIMVTSNERDPLMPDVPSAREVGLENFEIANWFGFFGPKGTDPAIIEKISADTALVLEEPEVRAQLQANGLTATYMNAPALKAYLAEEMDKYGGIIARSGIEKQ